MYWLYCLTIFLGAFLLFSVQPLMGKFVLPWFGGGAGVWNTCMVFFQVGLLAGYLYAHVLFRFVKARWQFPTHVACLAVSMLWLSIMPQESLKPQAVDEPMRGILQLLGQCIGGPFLMLSATSPLVAAWFERTYRAGQPYRLYALSNIGSLVALLSYPFVVEPTLTRGAQATTWSWLYVVFAIAFAVCAFHTSRSKLSIPASELAGQSRPASSEQTKTGTIARILWVALPLCSSILLLSFTARLSEEIAPVPFLWVVPLAVYLLTFIISFEWPKAYHRSAYMALVIISYLLLLLTDYIPSMPLLWTVVIFMFALFSCCMACHGEVYRLRPAPERLTSFYLAIGLGGALGGVLVSLVAPIVLNGRYEFDTALYGTFALMLACSWQDGRSVFHRGARPAAWLGLSGLVLAIALCVQWTGTQKEAGIILRKRNFFGVLTVARPETAVGHRFMALRHGHILHGAQRIDPGFIDTPTAYYGQTTGIGRLISSMDDRPRRIGVVGLGVGTIAAAAKAEDVVRFYELDPSVIALAHNPFSFIDRSKARVEIVPGDARLSLERESPQNFDLLVLDAFSGDAIPIHLLTTEAFDLYEQHLNKDGAIAVHITNAHLRLNLLLATIAEQRHYEFRIASTPPDPSQMISPAVWVVLTKQPALFEHPLVADVFQKPPSSFRHVDVWTDDRANLLQVLH